MCSCSTKGRASLVIERETEAEEEVGRWRSGRGRGGR